MSPGREFWLITLCGAFAAYFAIAVLHILYLAICKGEWWAIGVVCFTTGITLAILEFLRETQPQEEPSK